MRALPLLGSLLFLCAASAYSAQIRIDSDPTAPTPVFTNSFGFSADQNGGGILPFVNDSGARWFSLDFFVTFGANQTITCPPGPLYATCTVTSSAIPGTSNAMYDISFETGPGAQTGIVFEQQFSVVLNDPDADRGSWGAGTNFEAVTDIAPEPSSIALLVVGIFLACSFVYGRGRAAA